MRVAAFCHSLDCDWNRGTAHFLRGIVSDLVRRGHPVDVLEPRDELDLDRVLDGIDLVLVRDSTPRDLVARIGAHRARNGGYTLLFHDAQHCSITEPASISAYGLASYDGVLACAEAIRERYLARGWSRRVWTWREAADTRVFYPHLRGDDTSESEGDAVFVGNWGDEHRIAQLEEMFVGPARDLGLSAEIHGVRYPAAGRAALAAAGVRYGGWLPNHRLPSLFSRYIATVHMPRRPSLEGLAGLPTMRAFEAMACGIPFVSTPWDDRESLFTPGADYLVARTPSEMTTHLRALTADADLRAALRAHALATVRRSHTCGHRVDELLTIASSLGVDTITCAPTNAFSAIAQVSALRGLTHQA